MVDDFLCRPGCGACCIAPSIRSPIPGMPEGKAAGERCLQLDEKNLCRLFGDPRRPAFCEGFTASAEVCGRDAAEAMDRLIRLEASTRPGSTDRRFSV